jgi:hypothetical protein
VRRFNAYLALISSAGLGLRLAYLYGPSVTSVSGDGSWYHLGAKYLADGKGFINPYELFFYGVTTPGAEHPPAWTAVLAVTSKLGLGSFRAHAVVACVIGTATVVVIGFVGRRLAGPSAGLIAATLAAVYVNLWMYESMLLSETLVIFGAAVTFLVALRFSESPSISRAIALGAVVGAMALIRAEQILLFGFLLVPLALIAPADSMQQGLRRLGAARWSVQSWW